MDRITINRNINNDLITKQLLADLSGVLDICKSELTIDFRNVTFIAGNQFSVIGALFDKFCDGSGKRLYLTNLAPNLKRIMQANGIGRILGFEPVKDNFHTSIPYQRFSIDDIDEFERYLFINIFERDDVPHMTENARNMIIDNILEVFNNVKEHTSSQWVYVCGQFFPKKAMLYFTIADMGETIKDNVIEYLRHINSTIKITNYIDWAIQEGNSTRIKGSPGGLGFSLLLKFIRMNKGYLSITSDKECYEFNGEKPQFSFLKSSFKGTIVTVGINMNDKFSYLSVDHSIKQIIF